MYVPTLLHAAVVLCLAALPFQWCQADDFRIDREQPVVLNRATFAEAIAAYWRLGDMRVALPRHLDVKPWTGITLSGTTSLRRILTQWCNASGLRWRIDGDVAVVENRDPSLNEAAEQAVMAYAAISSTRQAPMLARLDRLLQSGAMPAGIGLVPLLDSSTHGQMVEMLINPPHQPAWRHPVLGIDVADARKMIAPQVSAELSRFQIAASLRLALMLGDREWTEATDLRIIEGFVSPSDREMPPTHSEYCEYRAQMINRGIASQFLAQRLLETLPIIQPERQAVFVQFIGRCGIPEAVPMIAHMANGDKETAEVRESAIRALAAIGNDLAIDTLAEMAEGPDLIEGHGLACLAALIQTHRPRAMAHVVAIRRRASATDPKRALIDNHLRGMADDEALALVRKLDPALINALPLPEPAELRRWTEPDAVARIKELLEDPELSGSSELSAIVAFRFAGVADLLISTAHSGKDYQRLAVIPRLPATRDPRALQFLQQSITDPDATIAAVSFRSLCALYRMDPLEFDNDRLKLIEYSRKHANAWIRAEGLALELETADPPRLLMAMREAITEDSIETIRVAVTHLVFRVVNMDDAQRSQLAPLMESIRPYATKDAEIATRLRMLEERINIR